MSVLSEMKLRIFVEIVGNTGCVGALASMN